VTDKEKTMSKKKSKTREEKIVKKHDFSHLLKTKSAAKAVEADMEIVGKIISPLAKETAKDVKMSLLVIGVFVIAIVVLWFLFGRNNEIIELYDKIKIF
jgi:hypothetical protein